MRTPVPAARRNWRLPRRPAAEASDGLDQPLNVLFLCTGNSARSILGEAILNHDGEGRFKAYSAGSNPIGTVNPWAIRTLKTLGYPAAGLLARRAGASLPNGPEFDLIFTVCDSAAAEDLPGMARVVRLPRTGAFLIRRRSRAAMRRRQPPSSMPFAC